MDPIFDELELMIMNDRIDELLKKLIGYLNAHSLNDEKQQLLVLGNQHNIVIKEWRINIISYEEYTRSRAKISFGLQKLIDELRAKEHAQVTSEPKPVIAPSWSEKIIAENDRSGGQSRTIYFFNKLLSLSANVCRIANNSKNAFYGSGCMLNDEWLLTNNHVIKSAEVAKDTVAQFNYEDEAGDLKPIYVCRLDETSLITNADLNYSLIKIKPTPGDPAAVQFAKLTIGDLAKETGETVSLIHHPFARPKEIDIDAAIIQPDDFKALYSAVTAPGSSGGLVLNASLEAIGIHTGKEVVDQKRHAYFLPIKSIIKFIDHPEKVNIFPTHFME